MVDRGREEINEAVLFLAWLRQHDATIDAVDQDLPDRYFHTHPSRVDILCTFLNWLPSLPGFSYPRIGKHNRW